MLCDQVLILNNSPELASERGNCQKMENTKMMLERQNKELKAKLEEVENSNRAKAKAAIGKFELSSLLTLFNFSFHLLLSEIHSISYFDILGENRGKACK